MVDGGRTYTARYVIAGKLMTVQLIGGKSKTSQLGAMTDVALARLLMIELISESQS